MVNVNVLIYLEECEERYPWIQYPLDNDVMDNVDEFKKMYIPLWGSKKYNGDLNDEVVYINDKIVYVSDKAIVAYANKKDVDFIVKYNIQDTIMYEIDSAETLVDALDGNLIYDYYSTFKVKIPIDHVFLVSTNNPDINKRDYILLGLDIDKEDILSSPVIIYPYGNIYDSFTACWGEEGSVNVNSISDWFHMYHNKDLYLFITVAEALFSRYDDRVDYGLPSWEIAIRCINREVERVKERYNNGENWKENTFLYTGFLRDFV